MYLDAALGQARGDAEILAPHAVQAPSQEEGQPDRGRLGYVVGGGAFIEIMKLAEDGRIRLEIRLRRWAGLETWRLPGKPGEPPREAVDHVPWCAADAELHEIVQVKLDPAQEKGQPRADVCGASGEVGIDRGHEPDAMALGAELARGFVHDQPAKRVPADEIRPLRLERPDFVDVMSRQVLDPRVDGRNTVQAGLLKGEEGLVTADMAGEATVAEDVAEPGVDEEEGRTRAGPAESGRAWATMPAGFPVSGSPRAV